MIERIGFIGGGAMAEAIIRALLAKEVVTADRIIASDPLVERRSRLSTQYRIETAAANRAATDRASPIVLAVKPQQVAAVLGELRGALTADQLVLSIVAGVKVQTIAAGLAHERIVRVMPNTPAQIGAGMSVWTATDAVSESERESVGAILQSLGRDIFVPTEDYLDMATAVSGSGPAYVFLFLEAMIDAAVHIGLARPIAEELVIQTALGSVLLAREDGRHLAALKNLVTSPAGTTADGLGALEDGRLRAVVDRAVTAAYERSKVLGKAV
ncbi:MAG TPA: pyrroline-5-carboxylate reductase [Chloroflexota bacterium]|nr:pyrroline-5-carboxylate reductase [Chloroflexota bacterium]